MVENNFKSLTEPLTISGTSYKLSLGLDGKFWALKIYKGKSLLDFKKSDISQKDFPDQNLFVQWILQVLVIPNLNPHLIMKTLQKLTKIALENKRKYIKTDDYLQKQKIKQKKQETLQIQKRKLRERQKFLSLILKLIKNGATGIEIMNEFKNHPNHHIGILRTYEPILKEIGDKRFLEYAEKEKNKNQFKRLNSAKSFLDVLKTENNHAKKKIIEIKNQLNDQ